jgi:6-pyruvoyltetrahydropterin/6-carboxytetrahydropterin synthase
MAKVTMVEEYAFCGAHSIPGFKGSRDAKTHGHTWKVAIEVEVELGPDGYAFDHAVLDTVARWVLRKIDHQVINEVDGLERGLNEDIAAWLGVEFSSALADHFETVDRATLRRLVLTQLSSGRTYRLTEHATVWEP